MTKIIFICEGNICRSPMAEFIFKNMLDEANMASDFDVTSRATILDTNGQDFYSKAKEQLIKHQIPFTDHLASQITIQEFRNADYIIGMENYNLVLLKRAIFIRDESKLHCLLDFTDTKRDISDPYYTRDFDKAYEDISYGCEGLLKYFKNKK